jgi:hypothetical protein
VHSRAQPGALAKLRAQLGALACLAQVSLSLRLGPRFFPLCPVYYYSDSWCGCCLINICKNSPHSDNVMMPNVSIAFFKYRNFFIPSREQYSVLVHFFALHIHTGDFFRLKWSFGGKDTKSYLSDA